MRPSRLFALGLGLLLLGGLAACGSDDVVVGAEEDALFAEAGGDADAEPSDEPDGPTRGDVDCTPEGLGEDGEVAFEVAYVVVDGDLGQRCLGDEDERLLVAWDDLVTITPADQLNDLALFAGFSSGEGGDEETLAFVNAVDDEGDAYQMSVNLDAYEDDEAQARLTMAHEFAHVFTQVPSQLDRSAEAFESCETYLSASGCFLPDSLIAAWVEVFWSDELLDSLDPDAEPTVAEGAERCASDPSFLGPYAASDPEEDFAESFSAYVYDVAVDSPEQQEKLDWLADQPGLVAFRDQAEEAGLTPLDHTFEPCG